MNNQRKVNNNDLIKNWKNSDKYKEFQYNLNEKKQDLIQLKIKLMEAKDEDKELSKEDLIQVLKMVKECDHEEAENDYDYSFFSAVGDSEEILFEYTSRLVNWFFYLGVYLSLEDYEIAAELRDVIAIEKRQFINLIKKYRQDILLVDENYLEIISNVDARLYKTINDNVISTDKK